MLSVNEVTEIFYLIDEFSKEFESSMPGLIQSLRGIAATYSSPLGSVSENLPYGVVHGHQLYSNKMNKVFLIVPGSRQ